MIWHRARILLMGDALWPTPKPPKVIEQIYLYILIASSFLHVSLGRMLSLSLSLHHKTTPKGLRHHHDDGKESLINCDTHTHTQSQTWDVLAGCKHEICMAKKINMYHQRSVKPLHKKYSIDKHGMKYLKKMASSSSFSWEREKERKIESQRLWHKIKRQRKWSQSAWLPVCVCLPVKKMPANSHTNAEAMERSLHLIDELAFSRGAMGEKKATSISLAVVVLSWDSLENGRHLNECVWRARKGVND